MALRRWGLTGPSIFGNPFARGFMGSPSLLLALHFLSPETETGSSVTLTESHCDTRLGLWAHLIMDRPEPPSHYPKHTFSHYKHSLVVPGGWSHTGTPTVAVDCSSEY